MIYTDGTKSENNIPAYSIVDEDGKILSLSILFENSSVLIAESCAIYQAICLYQPFGNKIYKKNPFKSNWNTKVVLPSGIFLQNARNILTHD